ncbi:hypothetical protein OF83DRAFT_1171428 [Amylostereum chailletii]|nr:hypothetical protein OF83DRAFT_1171428 [Amylostereum chailletii]
MDMMDDAKDVVDFLKAMYFPRYTQRHLGCTIDSLDRSKFPGMYEGVLRLAQKYDAHELRGIVVEAIRKEWPTTLKQWYMKRRELNMNGYAEFVDGQPWDADVCIVSSDVYPDAAQAIRLAVDLDIPSILPVAFYDLACTFMDYSRDPDAPDKASMLDRLSPMELRSLVLGTAALRNEVRTAELFFRQLQGFCSGDDRACMEVIITWCQTTLSSMYRSSNLLEWLQLQEKHKDLMQLRGLCGLCSSRAKERLSEKVVDIWQRLPLLFGLTDVVGENWGRH